MFGYSREGIALYGVKQAEAFQSAGECLLEPDKAQGQPGFIEEVLGSSELRCAAKEMVPLLEKRPDIFF